MVRGREFAGNRFLTVPARLGPGNRTLIAALVAMQCAVSATRTVEGAVLDSVTGAGVPNASITLEGRAVYRATTEANGVFKIEGVAEGEYRATFAAAGYVAPDLKTRLTQAFRVGGVPSRLSVTLVPAGTVAGRVIDPDNKPVIGSEVTLEAYGGFNASSVTTEPVGGVGARLELLGSSFSQSVKTGPDGTFRFSGISPGSYRLSADPPAGLKPPAPRAGQALGWVRAFFPDSSSPEIDIAAGLQLAGQDIQLRPVPVYQIRGVVAGPRGARVQLRIVPDHGPRVREIATFSKADGTFIFPAVPDGGWRLSATAKELKAFKWVHVTGRDTDRIALRLGTPFAVHGTIEVPGSPESPGGCIVLAPEEGGNDAPQSCSGTREFTIANVFRRVYWIQPLAFPTFKNNDYYLASIALGERDAMGQAVELKPDSPPLHIVYKEGGGTLKGNVADCGRATVLVVPQEAALRRNIFYRLIRKASCNQTGGFQILNLRPGGYYAFALDRYRAQPNEFEELDPAITAKAAIVDIRDAETQTVELRVLTVGLGPKK